MYSVHVICTCVCMHTCTYMYMYYLHEYVHCVPICNYSHLLAAEDSDAPRASVKVVETKTNKKKGRSLSPSTPLSWLYQLPSCHLTAQKRPSGETVDASQEKRMKVSNHCNNL